MTLEGRDEAWARVAVTVKTQLKGIHIYVVIEKHDLQTVLEQSSDI